MFIFTIEARVIFQQGKLVSLAAQWGLRQQSQGFTVK